MRVDAAPAGIAATRWLGCCGSLCSVALPKTSRRHSHRPLRSSTPQPSSSDERSAMKRALTTMREYATRGIHFDFDTASIRPSSNALPGEIATTPQNNPLLTLQIAGHSDSIGKPAFTQKLSWQRAEVVLTALVKRGVSHARLTTAGAAVPVATNKTLERREMNWRLVRIRMDR